MVTTPSLDPNTIHNTAHMKGAGVAQSAHQLGYRLDSPRFESQKGQDFFFSTTSRPALGPTQPLFNGYPNSFLGERRPRTEVNHHLHSPYILSRCGQRKPPFAFYCKHNSIRFTAT
jgi:hypothetical protein